MRTVAEHRPTMISEPLRSTFIASIEPVAVDACRAESRTIGMPGTIVLFVGHANSVALDRVRTAATDTAAAVELARDLYAQFSRPQLTYEAAARIVAEQPAYADVVSEGEILAEALFPPHADGLAMVVFPYHGGRVAPGDLQLHQRVVDDAPADLAGVAIVNQPELTASERVAAAFVDDRAPVIERAKWCETTWRAMAVLVGVAAMAGLAVISTSDVAPLEEQDLDVDRYRRLQPKASAAQLMEFRAAEIRAAHRRGR